MSAHHTPGLRMQYIGACSLLARLSGRRELSEEDRDCIGRALADCVASFPDSFELVDLSNGGYSLEPIFAKANRSAP